MKLKIKPGFFYDEEGNKIGVLLKLEEFGEIMDELEDLHDVCMVYERTAQETKTIPYDEVMKEVLDAKK
ncbi:MAG: hypothetical protein WD055_02770 [Candidatus Dependentiae bacterium]